jgi:hypothetical protein
VQEITDEFWKCDCSVRADCSLFARKPAHSSPYLPRTGGRRKASETLRPEQLDRAKQLYVARQNSIAEIMALTGFKSRATFYKYIVNAER